MNSKLLGFPLIVILITALCSLLLHFGTLDEIENRTWDWRVQATADPLRADSSIKIIMIDQTSLEYFSQEESIVWPWPRGLYEAIITFLRKGGARGVAFDILFSEPSSYGVDDDRTMAESFGATPPIVSALAFRSSGEARRDSVIAAFEKKQSVIATTLPPALSTLIPSDNTFLQPWKRFKGATLPVLPLVNASSGFGNVAADPDSDGIYRHIRPGGYVNSVPVFNLPFALYGAASRPEEHTASPSRFLDKQGRLPVRFHGPARTYPTIRFSAVIQSLRALELNQAPSIPLETFKDSWVLIGMDAPGLLDLRPTSLSELFPGVELHATVLDNLLHNDFTKRTSSTQDLLFTGLLALLCSASVIFLSKTSHQFAAVSLLLGATLLTWYLTASYGIWIAAAVPLLGAALSVLASLSFQYQLEGKQHRFIKDAFRYYVSPDVIEDIVKDPSTLALGGARRELSIFFSDLAGFTAISESIDPQRLVTLLNHYLSRMTDIILSTGGTVDKYEGDAIIAFWNAPLSVPDHAERAVRAALLCQEELERMRPSLEAEYGVKLKMRIGINTGLVNVGNFGSKDRFNYTVIGDAANLASRLEGVNKVFGTSILFSKTTRDALSSSIPCRRIGAVQVVGRAMPVPVFIPDSGDSTRFDAALTLFEEGKLAAALPLFEELAENDPVSMAYATRITSHTDTSGTFDPVWVLSSK